MVRTLERVVEQIVDVQATQVTKKTTKIPKISQQVEHTQYHCRLSHDRIQRIIEQVVNAQVVNTVEVKHPTNPQENEATSSE